MNQDSRREDTRRDDTGCHIGKIPLNITLCRKEKRGGFYLHERKPLPCLECRLGSRNGMTGMIAMADVIMNGLKSLPF